MAEPTTIDIRVPRLNHLSKVGNFVEAKSLWNREPGHLTRSYDFVIAYLDCLRQQNAYGEIEDLILQDTDQFSYTEREQRLLQLYLAFARIYIHGALRYAIQEARVMHSILAAEGLSSYDMYHVRAIELYIRIVKLGSHHSTFIAMNELELPGNVANEDLGGPWRTSYYWFNALLDAGNRWEALSLLQIMEYSIRKEQTLAGYRRMLDAAAPSAGHETDLFDIGATIALSRFTTSIKDPLKGTELANQAQSDFERLCGDVTDQQSAAPRQHIQLRLALLEALMESEQTLPEYQAIAQVCRNSLDYSFEDYVLDTRARIAAKFRLFDELDRGRLRLQEVQSVLKRDAISLLQTTCGLWIADHDRQRGAIQDFFNRFDEQYPIAALSGPPSSTGWDFPAVRARGQYLKYLNSRTLGLTDQTGPAMRLSMTLQSFTPIQTIRSDLGLGESWLFEWSSPTTPEPLNAITVLTNRMHDAAKDSQQGEQSHRLLRQFFVDSTKLTEVPMFPISNISLVTREQVQQLLLPIPFDQMTFLHRMDLLSSWFASVDLYSRDASDYLLAELHRLRILVPVTSNDMEANWKAMRMNTDTYVHFVNHEASATIRENLHSTVLTARRSVLEMGTRIPFRKTKDVLVELLHGYDSLLAEYAAHPQLRGSLRAQAALSGWSSVVAIALGDLDQFEQRNLVTQTFFDELRSELSAFDTLVALEAKAELRQMLDGSQAILPQCVSDLVRMYFATASEDTDRRGRIAGLVWEVVQESKNRAVNDVVGLRAPSVEVASLADSVRTQLEQWQMQLKEVNSARKAGDLLRLERARSALRALEATLMQDEAGRGALLLYNGRAITLEEMRMLAKEEDLNNVVLVDWFTANTNVPAMLHAIVLRLSVDHEEAPRISRLEGMGPRAAEWFATYLACPAPLVALRSRSAYADLQTLQGLVQPLVEMTTDQDALIFCPTTEWEISRIPLHALELPNERIEHKLEAFSIEPPGAAASTTLAGDDDEQDGEDEDDEDVMRAQQGRSLLFRNEITYTYSHSLLRHSLYTRKTSTQKDHTCEARLLSPLSESAPSDPIMQQLRNLRTLFSAESTRITAGSTVTLPNVETEVHAADFVYFFGHIHPAARPVEPRAPPVPLSAHLLLFVDKPAAGCQGPNMHATNECLTGDRIISHIELSAGAHVVLVACGGAVSTAKVTDDVLGLVPALLVAGASSATAVLWEVPAQAAIEWTRFFYIAWRDRKEAAGFEGQVNVAACAQEASRSLCRQRRFDDIVAWAGWTHYGNWNFRVS